MSRVGFERELLFLGIDNGTGTDAYTGTNSSAAADVVNNTDTVLTPTAILLLVRYDTFNSNNAGADIDTETDTDIAMVSNTDTDTDTDTGTGTDTDIDTNPKQRPFGARRRHQTGV